MADKPVVIWRHVDGRTFCVYEDRKLGFFPPGYVGSGTRRLAPLNFPAGTTCAVLYRSQVPNLLDSDWYGPPTTEVSAWTKVEQETENNDQDQPH